VERVVPGALIGAANVQPWAEPTNASGTTRSTLNCMVPAQFLARVIWYRSSVRPISWS